ncbi:MAG: pyridoxal phosphate-dependent aminotransferase [Candidatus Methanofastidiosia archaeon]
MIETLVRQDIESLRFAQPYVPKKYLNLSQNEPIRKIIGDKYSAKYIGPHYYELKNKLAELFGLKQENFTITNGANHGIDVCCRCFLGPGDCSALYDPTYGPYYMIPRINGKDVVRFQLDENFEPDWQQFKDSNAKMVFIANPGNPTGNLLSLKKIEEGLETGKVVVVDEAYAEFTNVTAIDLIDNYENLVVLRTFSKVWALPGARVGYIVANEKTSDYLELSHIPYHMANPSLKLAYDVIDHKEDMERLVKETVNIREELRIGLQAFGLYVYPSYTNFLLVKFPEQINANTIFQKLCENNICVNNVSGQAGIENCLRISVGLQEENATFLAVLKKLLDTPI